jgi:hypothetical protein
VPARSGHLALFSVSICDIRWPTSMSPSYWQNEAWEWMPVVFGVGCKSTRRN